MTAMEMSEVGRSDNVPIYCQVQKLRSKQIFNKYAIFVKLILLYASTVNQDGECVIYRMSQKNVLTF
jgi:hypothetical protein